jgi:hypothetical protein
MPDNDGAIISRLDSMQESIDTLARGLTMLAETLGTHSEMMSQILEACSADPGESPVADLLEQIAAAINQQNEALVTIGETLEHIGPSIEVAVIRGVHRAVGTADDDGVVQE